MHQDTMNSSETDKRTKERSAAYPSATIETIVGFVDQLKKSFQKTMFTREDIAAVLDRGSTIRRDISAAVQYGLVDKTVGEGYKLTQLTEHILEPFSQEEKMDNVAECFRRPKLYADLIEKFQGQPLPANEVLRVILSRQHSITSAAAPQAVEVFVENASYAGLLNSQRILMPGGSRELSVPAVKGEDSSLSNDIAQDDAPDAVKFSDSTSSVNSNNTEESTPRLLLEDGNSKHEVTVIIRLSEKKVARLVYPDTINARDIQILKMQIDLLELTIDS